MRIRLIGIGDNGLSIAHSCFLHFKEQRLDHFIEECYAILPTQDDFCDAVNKTLEQTKKHITSPAQIATLKDGIARLMFGGTSSRAQLAEIKRTVHEKTGSTLDDHVAPFGQKFSKWKSQFEFGTDGWLITPALPLSSARKFQTPGMAESLVCKTLEDNPAPISGLGEDADSHKSADVIAICFSSEDCFGSVGAEVVARAIRRKLESPWANRVVAVVGFCQYGDCAMDGRLAASYLSNERKTGQFDGLFPRPAGESDRTQGFPALLTYLAIASDRMIRQIDNPDANQLQRDFGRRLVCFGIADLVNHGVQVGAGNLMNVEQLYETAISRIDRCYGELTHRIHPYIHKLQALREQLEGDGFKIPEWLEKLSQEESKNQLLRQTARKVIAFVGYSDQLDAKEVSTLRQRIATEFPNARTVIYKYAVAWNEDVSVADGGDGKSNDSGTWVTRLREWTRQVQSLDATGGGVAAGDDAESKFQLPAHLCLFVVDSFDYLAIDRLLHFYEERVGFLNPHGSLLLKELERPEVLRVQQELFSRTLLSLPVNEGGSIDDAFKPDKTRSGQPRSSWRDSILGGVDESFLEDLRKSIQKVVAGEVVVETDVRSEATEISWSVDRVPTYLIPDGEESLASQDEVAHVLSGLNRVCNERVEKRTVIQGFDQYLTPTRGETIAGLAKKKEA